MQTYRYLSQFQEYKPFVKVIFEHLSTNEIPTLPFCQSYTDTLETSKMDDLTHIRILKRNFGLSENPFIIDNIRILETLACKRRCCKIPIKEFLFVEYDFEENKNKFYYGDEEDEIKKMHHYIKQCIEILDNNFKLRCLYLETKHLDRVNLFFKTPRTTLFKIDAIFFLANFRFGNPWIIELRKLMLKECLSYFHDDLKIQMIIKSEYNCKYGTVPMACLIPTVLETRDRANAIWVPENRELKLWILVTEFEKKYNPQIVLEIPVIPVHPKTVEEYMNEILNGFKDFFDVRNQSKAYHFVETLLFGILGSKLLFQYFCETNDIDEIVVEDPLLSDEFNWFNKIQEKYFKKLKRCSNAEFVKTVSIAEYALKEFISLNHQPIRNIMLRIDPSFKKVKEFNNQEEIYEYANTIIRRYVMPSEYEDVLEGLKYEESYPLLSYVETKLLSLLNYQ